MAGRVWTHHATGGGTFELHAGRDVDVVLNFSTRVKRPNELIRRYLAITAAHHGEDYRHVGGDGIDWQALGWLDRRDHDESVAGVAKILEAWPAGPLRERAVTYVHEEKETAGIPTRPPYSFEQVAELHSILERAPRIAEQDALAEGTAP